MSQEYRIISISAVTNGGITEIETTFVNTTAATITFGSVTLNNITASTVTSNSFYGNGSNLSNLPDNYVTGGTYSNGTLTLNRQNGSVVVTGFSTGGTDTYVTGFTYNNTNKLTISQNFGQPDLNVSIDIMSGLTVTGNINVNNVTITGSSAGQEFNLYRYSNDNVAGGLLSYKARGSINSPSAILSGDTILNLGARGYFGTGFTSNSRGSIQINAIENWSVTNQGTYISFNTTPSGSTTRSEVGRIDNTGLSIGAINNEVQVRSLNDFPTPIGNSINLTTNTAYRIKGTINLGSNYISANTSNIIYGVDKSTDKLIYTGTGSAIRVVNNDLSLRFLTLAAITPGSSVFNISNSATNNVQITDNIFGSNISLGTINGGNFIIIDRNLMSANSGGLNVGGTVGYLTYADNEHVSNSGTSLTVSGGNFTNIYITRNLFNIQTGQTCVNIVSGLTITNGTINNNIFIGSGTYLTTVNPNVSGWTFSSNVGIANMTRHRLVPNSDILGMTLTNPTVGTAATAGTLGSTGSRFLIFAGGANVQTGAGFTMKVPGDYFSGGYFQIETTNVSSPSGTIKFFMSVTKINPGSDFATIGENNLNVVLTGTTAQYNMIRSNIIPVTTIFSPNDTLVCRIWRDTADSQDTVGNTIDAYLNSINFIYNSK